MTLVKLVSTRRDGIHRTETAMAGGRSSSRCFADDIWETLQCGVSPRHRGSSVPAPGFAQMSPTFFGKYFAVLSLVNVAGRLSSSHSLVERTMWKSVVIRACLVNPPCFFLDVVVYPSHLLVLSVNCRNFPQDSRRRCNGGPVV